MTHLDSKTGITRFNQARGGLAMRSLAGGLAAIALLVAPISAGADPTAPNRYLFASPDLKKLGFDLPPPPLAPKDSDASLIDLDQVRAAQLADGPAKAEAFDDAEAYLYEVLLPRFSTAAGRSLTITRRPILAHMLRWLVADVDFYKVKETVGADGTHYFRARPFIEDSSIKPCDQSYMTVPGKPNDSDSSYPSGHAAHGYVAGLLLSTVMPDRGGTILARGVRFGTNRIICGVHFPTDVAMGQRYARFIFSQASNEPAFKDDLACALEEDLLDRTGKLPARVADPKSGNYLTPSSGFSAKCQQLDVAYFQEALDKARGTTLNLWPTKQ